MKNAHVPFLGFCVALLVTGCSTVKPEPPLEPVPVMPEAKPTDYAIETLMLDVNKLSRKLLFSSPDANLQTVVKDPSTVASRFPVLYVTPGTNIVVDNRKVYRYPVEFDAQGQPTKFETHGVGQLIQAGLSVDKSGTVLIALAMEDSTAVSFERIKTGGKEVYERPTCRTRQASLRAPVELDKWVLASNDSMLVETKEKKVATEERVWRVTLIKVVPPKKSAAR